MLDPHERLQAAREEAGFEDATAAARAFGWNENTYRSHENGVRGLKRSVAETYARAFKVSAAWLLTGEGGLKKKSNVVSVVGRVGAGAEVLPEFEQLPPEGLFEIEVPFPLPKDAIALEVDGTSMWPRYDPGDVVICWREGTNINEIIGWEAAVRTDDGRRFLKRVLKGSTPGHYDLESHNAPTIRNVKLEWASEVQHVVRAGRWQKLGPGARRNLLRSMSKDRASA